MEIKQYEMTIKIIQKFSSEIRTTIKTHTSHTKNKERESKIELDGTHENGQKQSGNG